MSAIERLREHRSDLPSAEETEARERHGWRLAAVEWERQAGGFGPALETGRREVPYGLRTSEDGHFLEDHPAEVEVLRLALGGMVDDCSLSEIASELNGAGYRTRRGEAWTQGDLFDLLPRLVGAGADILRSEAWSSRERREPRLQAV